MFEKLARSAALGVVAASAGATAIGIGAFALYSALEETRLSQAAAAGIVAALFLLVAIGAVLALRGGGAARTEVATTSSSGGGPLAQLAGLRERATGLLGQRPLVAGAVGLVAAVYLLRNPTLLAALIGAAAGRAEGKSEARRGFF